ncbi:helix-turn-helix transcriptional regulator [Nonomuraea sp. SMC257]|uniref:Helix-turn-helix transcriptional regulator n=1 Tax=Nonomuraea montanisoli TaxID=2741721 RepID=A0A7Y6IJI8_9ACTN|nr:helix-turn-helix transcriptional regulator [Nonomuraea montanisoli]NUW38019.1 helix-turn-helix transcriptional regulator [Nonomuraea montanisoli]
MYEERPPTPELAGRVVCVWGQVPASDGTQLVVPDGCVDLIWGPAGLFVAGPDTGPMPAPMRVGEVFAGVRFGPGATGEVFGVPVHGLRDQRVPLAALNPADWSPFLAPDTVSSLSAGTIPYGPGHLLGERLRLMRRAVAARIRETAPADPAAPALVAALRSGLSVREAAWELGFSERQLHRRSVAGFGYPPKTLQRVVRFQRALRLARSGVALAEVAAASGYADQAHLSHDVKRLSGVPLSRLLT